MSNTEVQYRDLPTSSRYIEGARQILRDIVSGSASFSTENVRDFKKLFKTKLIEETPEAELIQKFEYAKQKQVDELDPEELEIVAFFTYLSKIPAVLIELIYKYSQPDICKYLGLVTAASLASTYNASCKAVTSS